MDAGIVVGTQMLAKGHDFPRVGLVGVIDVDQGLFSVDLRAAEQTLQLVLQAAGRAGRGGDPGAVLVQTGHPEHPLMQGLRGGDYPTMVEPLLNERRAGGMPPFGFLALIRVDGPSPETSARQAEEIAQQLRRHVRDVRVLGPAPAPRHRVNRRFREQILLASASRKPLHQALADAREHWQRNPPPATSASASTSTRSPSPNPVGAASSRDQPDTQSRPEVAPTPAPTRRSGFQPRSPSPQSRPEVAPTPAPTRRSGFQPRSPSPQSRPEVAPTHANHA
jgi:hypothetical protein